AAAAGEGVATDAAEQGGVTIETGQGVAGAVAGDEVVEAVARSVDLAGVEHRVLDVVEHEALVVAAFAVLGGAGAGVAEEQPARLVGLGVVLVRTAIPEVEVVLEGGRGAD